MAFNAFGAQISPSPLMTTPRSPPSHQCQSMHSGPKFPLPRFIRRTQVCYLITSHFTHLLPTSTTIWMQRYRRRSLLFDQVRPY
jgi:hypothetical protein